MTQWPNFFVAGAPRCGTSTLHAWLPTLPGVFMARIKEPNHFSRRVIGDEFPMVKLIRRDRDYLRLFEDARVLVTLRDPVGRLFSHYLMMRNNLPGMGSFMHEIERGLSLQGIRNVAYLDPAHAEAQGVAGDGLRRTNRDPRRPAEGDRRDACGG